MEYQIQLCRGARFEQAGQVPLIEVVRESLQRILARKLDDVSLQLTLLSAPDDWLIAGPPIIYNLMPNLGYAQVVIRDKAGTTVHYQHPHPLGELVGQTLLHRLKTQYPDETQWGFYVTGPGVPVVPIRPTPQVEKSIEVNSNDSATGCGFVLKPAPVETWPTISLTDFDLRLARQDSSAPVKVVLPRALWRELCHTRRFSSAVEEGGFLLGRVFKEAGNGHAHILELTAALEAEHTGASFLHFTFTGDSYRSRNLALRRSCPDIRVLGWYHTHLFPATDVMGLSSIDLRLHFGTFLQPWHLAGLINLDGNHRTLRFYVRHGDSMALCPMWIIEHERP